MSTKYPLDTTATLESLNKLNKGTMGEHIGIEFIELTEEYLKARMPVDHRTWQPLKMLNGGASLALAETLGSTAANLTIDRKEYVALGLDINANHLKAATTGYVYGTARPYHVGKSTQVWEIRIEDEEGNLTCICRLTMSNVKIDNNAKYIRRVDI
ncbi:MAG TPA: hotdog fold thioesterase [Bacteroidia bacterium]|nr:hotdog fold thioesterase [Bacteroidia bacterium]